MPARLSARDVQPGEAASSSAQSPSAAAAAAVNIAAGTIGSMCGEAAVFPIDVVKTRLMTATVSEAPMAALALLVRERGLLGIYSGLPSPLCGAFLIKSSLFAGYELSKVCVHASRTVRHGRDADMARPLDKAEGLFSAAFAGIFAAMATCPVDRVKIVMQTRPNAHASTLHCALALARERSLSLGLGATLAREVPSSAIYFSVYESTREALLPLCPAAAAAPLAGATCGVISWLACCPIDVAKTRVQSGAAPSLLAALRAVAEERAFFRGVQPVVMRAVLKHATVFAVYEQLRPRLLALGT